LGCGRFTISKGRPLPVSLIAIVCYIPSNWIAGIIGNGFYSRFSESRDNPRASGVNAPKQIIFDINNKNA
jgi:hypothetical protein